MLQMQHCCANIFIVINNEGFMQVSYSKSIYYNVRLTSRYLKAFIAQILSKLNTGISADEVFTLDILKCDGSMCQRDLAKLLFKDRANTGKIAQSLEEKGLIQINSEQKNNRFVKNLSLTEKGIKFLNELNEKSMPILNKISEKFSEEEYEILIKSLTKIINEIKPVLETQI